MSRLHDALRATRDEEGFTLVELLVAMFVLLIVSSIATSVFVGLQKGLRKQNGYVDAQQSSRAVYQQLDRQVRYANVVTVPGVDAAGNQYVEWQTADPASGRQKCTQWRVTTTGLAQQRSWSVPLATDAVQTVVAPAWATVADGLLVTGRPAVFTSPVAQPAGSSAVPVLQQLGVVFTTQKGSPPGRASTQTVFTAANSSATTSAAVLAATCTQVPRS